METLNSLCLVKSCKALPCKEKNFLTTYIYHPYISLNEHVIGGDTPCFFYNWGGKVAVKKYSFMISGKLGFVWIL